MSSISWLHLTDFHQGMRDQNLLWPAVREDFYHDLKQLHEKSGPWEIVLFTGDLAYSGKKEEYDALNRELSELWNVLKNLGSTPILLPIPGNHDLARPDSKKGAVRALKQWHTDSELRELFWSKDKIDENEYRQVVINAFSSFMEWRQSSPLVPEAELNSGLLPGDFSFTLDKDGLKVGIIGLNSSFLQLAGGDYEGQLDLDIQQLQGACNGDAVRWLKDHHLTFLLTHHPQSWLHSESLKTFKAEINPAGRFTLHLFGHMHEALSHSLRIGGSPIQRYLQGASLFGLETWGDGTKERLHGYSAGQFSAIGDEARIQIWPRNMRELKAGHRKITPHIELDLDSDNSIVEILKLSKPLITPEITSIITSEVTPALRDEVEVENPPTIEIVEKSIIPAKSYDLSNYVFFVPYEQKGNQVVGRNEDLEKVRQYLKHEQQASRRAAAVIEGIGGLGKTQLAVECAYNFKEDYPNGVIWLNVDQDVEVQLIELVDKAGWIAPKSEHKDKLAVAKQRLKTYSDCLVILDNIEVRDTVNDLLQLFHNDTHFLATTRLELPNFVPILLDPLNHSLSHDLLIQEAHREPSGQQEIDAANAIVETLSGLPLAIELAGAYLRHRPTVGWEQYQRLLAKNLREALPQKFLQNAFTKHKADLYLTLKINESLFDDEPELRNILDLLAWSGSAPMGEDLLCYLLNVEDSIDLLNALGLGTTLRLLSKAQNNNGYAIHRLVREVRREDVPLEGREDFVASICEAISQWFKKKRSNFSDLTIYEAEIDHLKAWEQNAVQYAPQLASKLIWLQAYPHFHQGRYVEAQNLLDRALALYEKLELQDLELKAHLLNDLGTICGLLGDFQKALNKHKESLDIRLDLYGDEHEDVAFSLSNIGLAYGNLGDYQQQLEYSQKALSLRQKILDENHPEIARSLNNIGNAYGYLGDYRQQLEHSQKALALYQNVLGENHPEVARSLNNVGNAYSHLGDYQQELEYSQKALALYQNVLGENHPSIARSLGNVGLAYGYLGDYRQQLEHSQKALALYQNVLGENHPEVAGSLNDVGLAYGNLGDYQQQLEYSQKALALYQNVLGENHPEVARSLNDVGLAYGNLGDYQQSIKFITASWEMLNKVNGKFHPITLQVSLNLATVYFNKGDKISAFQIINPLMAHIPKSHRLYPNFKHLHQILSQRSNQKGFRQPPANPHKRKKKRK